MRRWLTAAGAWLVIAAPAAGAATWRDLAVPESSEVSALTVSRSIPGLAWAVGVEQLLVTRDGGLSWSPTGIARTQVPLPRQEPVEDAAAPRLWHLTEEGLQRSDDGGGTWQDVPGLREVLADPAGYLSAKQLLADPARSGVLYVIAGTGSLETEAGETVLASRDGGATWTHWDIALRIYERYDWGFTDTWNVLPGRDALLLVRAGGLADDVEQELSVVTATGRTRLQYGTGSRGTDEPAGGKILGLTLTARDAVDSTGTRVLLESTHGWELSTDGAAHFHLLRPVIPARRVPPVFDPSNPHRIYALRAGRLVRSDDDGQSWIELAAGLRSAQSLAVDGGGLVYASGPGELATSSDAGRTFTLVRGLGVSVLIGTLQDDGHGGLLAATERGVWRIAANERWSPVDHDLFPLPAALATPLGQTRKVLALRSPAGERGERSTDPKMRLEVLGASGSAVRALPLPARATTSGAAFTADASARHITLGADWTATGGQRWHLGHATDTSAALSAAGEVYATRDHPRRAGRASLWLRAGVRPWKQIASFAGRGCAVAAAGPKRVYVECSDHLLRSDDNGSTLRRIAVPHSLVNRMSMAVDQRRPDHIALLLREYGRDCGLGDRGITLTSTDGGTTWQSTADACSGPRYEKLEIAPNGSLLRWSNVDPTAPLQVLDDWR